MERGTIYFSESRVKTDLFDHTGHQSIGYLYSNKQYTSLNQTSVNSSSAMTSGAWLMYYNFDQFLYETADGSGKGWGGFGRFGVSDGNPNKIKYFWSLGLGAVKGAIEARPNDTFGIGLYNSIISKTTQASAQGLKNECGVEGYYNIALTPWAYLSPDKHRFKSRYARLPLGIHGCNRDHRVGRLPARLYDDAGPEP
jgi:porin